MTTEIPSSVIRSISSKAERIRSAFANVQNAPTYLIVKDDADFLGAALSRMSRALKADADLVDLVDTEVIEAINTYFKRIRGALHDVEAVTRTFVNVNDIQKLNVIVETSDYFRYVSMSLQEYSTRLDSLSLALETRSSTRLKENVFSSLRSLHELRVSYEDMFNEYTQLQLRIESLIKDQFPRVGTWAKDKAVGPHSSGSQSIRIGNTPGSVGSRQSTMFDRHSRASSFSIPTGIPKTPEMAQSSSDLPKISQLLDPHAHFTSINNLGDHIEALLALEDSDRFFLRFSDDGDAQRVHVSNNPLSSPYDIRCRISNIVRALHEMQRAGFCTDNIIFFSRWPTAPDIIRADDLSIKLIERIDESLAGLKILYHRDVWEAIIPLMNNITIFKFGHLDISLDGIRSHDPDFVNHWMVALVSLLEVAVLLYFHSNISSDDFRINGKIFDGMTVPSSKHGEGFRFRRRHLTCMHHFLKAPVWVFERDDVPNLDKCDLLILTAQLADLWGPVSTLPSETDSARLKLLRLEGGVLYRRPLAEGYPQTGYELVDGPRIPRKAIARMHFTPWKISPDRTLAGSMSVAMELPPGEAFPLELQDFSLNDMLLIGHPLATDTASTQEIPASDTSSSITRMTLSASTAAVTFSSDGACPLNMANYEQENAHRIRALGTSPERLVCESYQLSVSGGQYVNVGVQKTWKKLPARTYKTMLLDYCSSPRAKVSTILDLKIGLEVSMCTGTSRRISLLETLKIASPLDATDIEEGYATEQITTIAPLLSSLEHTGVRSDGTFYAYWPDAKGFPEGLKMPHAAWTCMLKDTHTSGCFATASSACLRYCIPGSPITRPMNGGCTFNDKTRYRALSTTIVLDPRHPRGILNYIDTRKKYELSEGSLSFAGNNPSLYAAFFHTSIGWKSRLRKRIKKDDEVGHESFDPTRSRYTANVCIVDFEK